MLKTPRHPKQEESFGHVCIAPTIGSIGMRLGSFSSNINFNTYTIRNLKLDRSKNHPCQVQKDNSIRWHAFQWGSGIGFYFNYLQPTEMSDCRIWSLYSSRVIFCKSYIGFFTYNSLSQRMLSINACRRSSLLMLKFEGITTVKRRNVMICFNLTDQIALFLRQYVWWISQRLSIISSFFL